MDTQRKTPLSLRIIGGLSVCLFFHPLSVSTAGVCLFSFICRHLYAEFDFPVASVYTYLPGCRVFLSMLFFG